MSTVISLTGKDVKLVNQKDLSLAIRAAQDIFEQHGVDPMECQLAIQKQSSDEEITRDEALLCIIWEEANYAAWHKATIGWMSRDVDLCLLTCWG